MSEQITDELLGIDLGDERLNKRSRQVIHALSVDPQASVNGSFTKWGDTLAAYRLLDNDAVTPEAILKPHYEATLARIDDHPVVLILQDTTELDFTTHAPKDAGCLNKSDRFGLYDHTHLAVTPDGLPLGVVGIEFFDRSAESLGRSLERRSWPIEEKESLRWLEGYRLSSTVRQRCEATQIVSVADSESDIYDILAEALPTTPKPGQADFIIRSKENRCTTDRIPPAEHASRNVMYRKVHDEVRQSPLRYKKTINLSQTPKRCARQAELEVRAMSVTLRHPKNRRDFPSVNCQIVHVKEINGPGDGTDIEWYLLTSLPVETFEDIERVLNYYQARWTIEVYFRTLKTGCSVEKVQLETTARMKNCLAFYQIIAWRVLSLTYLNRECPTLPCTSVFTDSEWQSVWRVTTKTELPDTPPSLSEFIRLLASLGGYNNRKTEPQPGPQPIWVGIRRMCDFALAWIAFGPPTKTYV
jgi:hypothetical protein